MNQINEKIEKISKSFSDLYKILEEFGTEDDKDALLEMVKFAIIGIVSSEKDASFKVSTEFKSEPVPNSIGSPLPHSPHTTGEPPPDEPFFISSTDGYPIQYHDTTT